MVKLKEAFLSITKNLAKVLKIGYEIDPKLINLYYITSFFAGISPIIVSYFMTRLIDNIITFQPITSNPLTIIAFSLFGYFLFQLSSSISYGLNQSYYDYLLRNKLQMGLVYRFLKKISSLDYGHLENSNTQNLINNVSNTYAWELPDTIRIWNYIFSNLVGLISSSIALISFGGWIPLVVVLVALPRLYFKIKYGNFVWSMFGGNAPESKKLWYMENLLTNNFSIMESRVFQSQEALLNKLTDIQKNLYEKNKIPLDNYRLVLIISPIIEVILLFIIVYSFIPNVLIGVLSIGSFTFFISIINRMSSDISWFSTHLGELYSKSLFIKPFFELMGLPKLIHESKNPKVVEKKPPLIEFKNVSFTYPNSEREIIKDVSFKINPGESIAFVGVNGAGKSTLIKLLCRFYDVTKGEILINGVNIKDLKIESWYDCIATLFQDFIKYNFSVKENIMLGNTKISDEQRMHEAAVKSGADEFIDKFKNKYNQLLGKWYSEGEELSGGQWQKLAIARAIYQDAPLLIMDEPTSAIDAESEFKIFKNLNKSYKGKSLILVSHRFSTVRNADKILVIDNGEIIEKGTHKELLTLGGKYATMFTTQAKGYQ